MSHASDDVALVASRTCGTTSTTRLMAILGYVELMLMRTDLRPTCDQAQEPGR